MSSKTQNPLYDKSSSITFYYIQLRLKENEDWDQDLYYASVNPKDMEQNSKCLIDNIEHVEHRFVKEIVHTQRSYYVVE